MTGDPAPRLLALYRGIHAERMAGLPFLNNAIAVDVLEFRVRDGRWSGLLITPWQISYVVFPDSPGEWAGLAQGTRRRGRVGEREVDFLVDFEPAIGHYQTCTLIAPVTQIPDQEAAHTAARTALARLLGPPAAVPSPPPDGRRHAPQPRRDREPVSRRGFFRSLLKG